MYLHIYEINTPYTANMWDEAAKTLFWVPQWFMTIFLILEMKFKIMRLSQARFQKYDNYDSSPGIGLGLDRTQ